MTLVAGMVYWWSNLDLLVVARVRGAFVVEYVKTGVVFWSSELLLVGVTCVMGAFVVVFVMTLVAGMVYWWSNLDLLVVARVRGAFVVEYVKTGVVFWSSELFLVGVTCVMGAFVVVFVMTLVTGTVCWWSSPNLLVVARVTGVENNRCLNVSKSFFDIVSRESTFGRPLILCTILKRV
jgi:hypothetical protein